MMQHEREPIQKKLPTVVNITTHIDNSVKPVINLKYVLNYFISGSISLCFQYLFLFS